MRQRRWLGQEKQAKWPVVKPGQFLRLSHRGLSLALLPCQQSFRLDIDPLRYGLGRIAALLACPREQNRVDEGWIRGGHRRTIREGKLAGVSRNTQLSCHGRRDERGAAFLEQDSCALGRDT